MTRSKTFHITDNNKIAIVETRLVFLSCSYVISIYRIIAKMTHVSCFYVNLSIIIASLLWL